MQTLWKPYLEYVPQLGQVVLAGMRESFFIICSGVADGIVFILLISYFEVVVVTMGYGMGGFGSMGCEVAVVRKWNLPGRTISVQPVFLLLLLRCRSLPLRFCFGTLRRACDGRAVIKGDLVCTHGRLTRDRLHSD